jgi:hypothetical protein
MGRAMYSCEREGRRLRDLGFGPASRFTSSDAVVDSGGYRVAEWYHYSYHFEEN